MSHESQPVLGYDKSFNFANAILLIFASGLGIIAYIILAIVVPPESLEAAEPKEVIKENVEEMKETRQREHYVTI